MCMCVYRYTREGQRRTSSVLLYYSSPYFLKTGSVTDPGLQHFLAKFMASESFQNFPSSMPQVLQVCGQRLKFYIVSAT